MRDLHRRSFLAGLTAGCGLLAAPTMAARTNETGGAAFGTYWRVLTPGDAARAGALAGRVFDAVDQSMSPYRAGSDLARFNAWDCTGEFRTAPMLARVASAALQTAALSGGAFDPTIGPLVARYGFGPIRGDGAASWRALGIAGGQLTKAGPGVTLDLCGIAKGYAIDALAARLDAAGFGDWLIDLGGELRARGRHPSGRAWRTAVARPFAADGQAVAALALGDEAVATSGPGEQSYLVGGRRIGHLIDPAARAPVAHGMASVSVVAPMAMQADAIATALAAMGPERGPRWARARGVDALFVAQGDGGAERLTATGRLAARIIGEGRGW